MNPETSRRRDAIVDLATLATLAALTAVLFGVTDLDLAAARPFYRPGAAQAWPLAGETVWRLAYVSAPFITAALAVVAVGAIVVGTLVRRGAKRRLRGLFLLLAIALGPGLVVNAVLKDHLGRARPRQLVEFGGEHAYTAPFVPGRAGAKSFPCGHCSVGFLVAAGWLVWRRERPRLAAASLAGGLALGTWLGIGRMAAGAHFLSDVLWSAWLALGVAAVLYHVVLRLPEREARLALAAAATREGPRRRAAILAGAVIAGALVLLGGALATPFDARPRWVVPRPPGPASRGVVEVAVRGADVEVTLVAGAGPVVTLSGEIHGFGLPGNRLCREEDVAPGPPLRATLRLDPCGVFTDLDGTVRMRVAAADVRRLVVRVRDGSARVEDRTAGAVALPALDVVAEHGRVDLPGSAGR